MNSTKLIPLRAALAGLALLCSSLGAHAVGYNTNLIVNGNAENGTVGWQAFAGTDMFQTVAYGNQWVRPEQPGPTDRGASLFAGQRSAYSAGYQLLDVSMLTSDFASGKVGYSLSGYLGGWNFEADNAVLYVSFLDRLDAELGSDAIGPVTPAERANQTGLLLRSVSGFMPAETQRIQFSLSMERLTSVDNDGYADNLSFTLSPVPEPQTYALMALGLFGIGLRLQARRRRG